MSIIVDKINNTRELITNTPYTDAEASIRRASIPMSKVLSGILSLSNTVKTLNFDAVTYNGNGGTQDIVTGISSVDFTVSGNGSGYWLDRSVNQVKTDANVFVASGECKVNTSKVHIKARSFASDNIVFDGVRGVYKRIYTDLTNIEDSSTGSLTTYTDTGFTVGTATTSNGSAVTYIAYQTLYTHIKWGVTSQGKFQIEAYNPVTNEGMIYYIGSGVAGHQISHSQGVEIDYIEVKQLTGVARNWHTYNSYSGATQYQQINTTIASTTGVEKWKNTEPTDLNITLGSGIDLNGAEEYIMYYKCKSETFTIGTYTGTGVAGNFVETKDVNGVARRPARVIIKAVSGTGSWLVFNNTSSFGAVMFLDTSAQEGTGWNGYIDIEVNGLTLNNNINDNRNFNSLNQRYLYLVEFDTDNTGTTGSYFDMATDTTNLQIADGLVSISSGYDSQGAINKVISKSGTMIPTGGYV